MGMLRGMTDEKPAQPHADAPPTLESDSPAPPSKMFGVPLDVFVKGGTTSMAHDRYIAQMEADAEKRRDEADREKALAKKYGIQAGNPNEVAGMFTHEFTDHPEIGKAYVPLMYMTPNGKEVDFYGVGDIIMVQDPKMPDELALLIFCPKCKERGLPASHCIITIRQSNRFWALDRRRSGELFIDPDGQPLHSAGEVVDGERFTCGRCSWAACIDRNRVITR